ncbi:MAG TPA: hypothetical protein VN602_08505 [Gemmatimonadaceae bacterium]|nr:hypothetical protein [Gemmatimonadaceae bacterium]
MKTRRSVWLSGLTLVAVTGVAACNAPAKPSSDLSRDLDAASSTSSSLTLAPTSGSRDVVSAVERAPDAQRAPAPAQKQVAEHRAPPAVVQPVAVAPQPVTPPQAVAAAPTTVTPTPATGEVTRRPTPVQQAPRGGYKTEAEVFRNAPFPIQP